VTIRLHGFGISAFRSFSDEQLLGPFDKVNIFIGENNSGKSNLLRFIKTVCHPITSEGQVPSRSPGDAPLSGRVQSARIPLLFPLSKSVLAEISSDLSNPPRFDEAHKLLTRAFGPPLEGYAWVPVSSAHTASIDLQSISFERLESSWAHNVWRSMEPNSGGGSFKENWLPGVYSRYLRSMRKQYQLIYVPTLRRIPTELPEYKAEYGEGGDRSIIDKLASWQNPTHNQRSDRAKFEKVESFLRKVLRRADVSLGVDHKKETITIDDSGRFLPIEALGTGIHQLVILAATALQYDDAVVCIEEPELHFHPELQHQFMQFIWDQTSNQYFMTTHSAHIMDAVPCAVYSVAHADGVSHVNQPLRAQDRHRICHNLGYRPSALLQANSLIWVEGPSDRLYLLHWLKAVAPELREGWHFSVMHYGGRLLSSVTSSDVVTDDFIQLLPINRFTGVLIDSDKKKEGDGINKTKTRIVDEVQGCDGFVWVTEGREIENYIPRQLLEAAVQVAISAEATLIRGDARYGKGLGYKVGGEEKKPDKMAVAKEVCKHPVDLTVLDLNVKVRELANFIYRANKMERTI
jgi:hypothetical protein